jgi:hypothetical protein
MHHKKAKNPGNDVEVPVDFPANIVKLYREWKAEYTPMEPIKKDQAELVLNLIPLDIRFLLGCGYDRGAAEEVEDPSPSCGLTGVSFGFGFWKRSKRGQITMCITDRQFKRLCAVA